MRVDFSTCTALRTLTLSGLFINTYTFFLASAPINLILEVLSIPAPNVSTIVLPILCDDRFIRYDHYSLVMQKLLWERLDEALMNWPAVLQVVVKVHIMYPCSESGCGKIHMIDGLQRKLSTLHAHGRLQILTTSVLDR